MAKNDLKAIHWATLDILERTGLRILSEKCLKMLDEAGCTVDYKNQSALIPSHLVEEALRKKGGAIIFSSQCISKGE